MIQQIPGMLSLDSTASAPTLLQVAAGLHGFLVRFSRDDQSIVTLMGCRLPQHQVIGMPAMKGMVEGT